MNNRKYPRRSCLSSRRYEILSFRLSASSLSCEAHTFSPAILKSLTFFSRCLMIKLLLSFFQAGSSEFLEKKPPQKFTFFFKPLPRFITSSFINLQPLITMLFKTITLASVVSLALAQAVSHSRALFNLFSSLIFTYKNCFFSPYLSISDLNYIQFILLSFPPSSLTFIIDLELSKIRPILYFLFFLLSHYQHAF